MSTTTTHTTKSTERKPPTIADIVREKTGDGALIIDFFTDVMTGRIDGAELCHRIDAAKQLVKYGSKDAAEFLAKYKGVPCGHSINGRPDQADPCSAEDRTLVEVTLNAPPTLTRDFLTVLSGIDEFLMARLIRAQTVDGVTIIEFLDDVMQDRTDGFKTHHRIAAAKELIVHIIRDEQPEPSSPVFPAKAGTHPSDPALSSVEGPDETPPIVVPAKAGTHPSDPALSSVEEPDETSPSVVPAKAGTHPSDPALSSVEEPDETSPSVVPAEAGTHPRDPEPGSQLETNNSKLETLPARPPRTRRTRTQRRRDGNARAAIRRKALASERIEEKKDEKPAPVELTIAERRIKEKLEQHWHEPDPYGAPIDSATPGRSPPW